MPRSDKEIVQFVKDCLVTCEPGFKDAEIVDSAVLKYFGKLVHSNSPSNPLQLHEYLISSEFHRIVHSS